MPFGANRRWAVPGLVTLGMLGGFVALLALGTQHRWEWGRVWSEGDYASYILGGLVTTAWISALGMLLGLLFGFVGGLSRLARSAALRQAGTTYVELVRGTPLLVQIMVAYYCVAPALRDGLRSLGAPAFASGAFDDPVFVGVIALGVFAGAYITEIVRAAVESVDRGQTEAALSQGMTHRQVLRLVLLPQSFRRMIPPLTGELVSLVKDSSLLSIIAVSELSKRASEVQAATYKTYEVFLPLALLYLCITFPLSRLARRLELRLR
jgi:polar amino acid transport system permease protein